MYFFFFSSRRRHTRSLCDWSSDVCSSDLGHAAAHGLRGRHGRARGVRKPLAVRTGARSPGRALQTGGPLRRGAFHYGARACPARAPAPGRQPQNGARVSQALRLVHQGGAGRRRLARAAVPDRLDATGRSDLLRLSRSDGGRAGGVKLDDLGRLFERLPLATIDHLRPLTQGHQEVILCQGKTAEQVVGIAERLAAASGSFLATRADPAQRAALAARFPRAEMNELGRTVYLPPEPEPAPTGRGTILVVTAGTSDLPVAEEAAVTARALSNRVERLTDVGVAGIHRVLTQADVLRSAAVVIVIAGMEGALPSVVGGLVRVPVIAVPTSVGYGASFGGVAALLGMLNSCAAGVTVVNIDNGFGAAMAAVRISQIDQV